MRHVHDSRPPTQAAPGQSPGNYSLVFDWVERACSLATIGWITLHTHTHTHTHSHTHTRTCITLHKRPSSLSPPQLHAPVHTHTHLTNMRVVGIGVKSGHAPYNLSVMPSCWCTGIGLSHIILHLIAYHVLSCRYCISLHIM